MEATVRSGSFGSSLRRHTPVFPATKHRSGCAAARPQVGDPLLESINEHAGPAWVASPDLLSISANPAARARIDSLAAECGPHNPNATRRRLNRIYEESLRSALKTAAHGGGSAPDAVEQCFPQRISCTIGGEKLDLLVLEVRTMSSLRGDALQAEGCEEAVAYLLVA
jgi:hypothetical protein